MTGVMSGVRILEVAEHTFVPAASALLADWGAEVIKIEHVSRGDAMRGLGMTGSMNLGGGGGVHPLLEHSNRGKKSLGLDLTTPEGREIVYKLAAKCDVFLTNKLPKVRKTLLIDVDDIRAHNPKIVYVRGSGYGSHGPDADRGGYDVLAYWSRSGLAMGATPTDIEFVVPQPAPGYGDSIGAMTIAGGISAALFHRERTGEAKEVDVSLLGTGMWAAGAGIALTLQSGLPWRPGTAIRTEVANPLAYSYRTKDDHWLFICCLQGFGYWPDLCAAIGREDLIDDDRFATAESFMANAYVAVQILQGEFLGSTLQEIKGKLSSFRGQWSPVQDSVEVLSDPQVDVNGYVQDVEGKEGTTFRLVASPVQFDNTPSRPRRAPDFNEHGDEILTNTIGLDWDTVIDLKVKGVVP